MSVFISILACDDRYRIDGIGFSPSRVEQEKLRVLHSPAALMNRQYVVAE
jgi:hypothetical protein